jgi:putative transposase
LIRLFVKGLKENHGNSMANTFTCLQYHVVFSTKRREPWLRPDFEERLWAYLGGIARQNELKPLLIGGVEDHIHMLLGLPPAVSVSQALQQIKGGSSGWIKQNLPGCKGFAWQDGYGAFSLSKSQEPQVQEYIRGQREHHRTKTFQEEYRALLARHGIAYDEQYLWG